MQRKTALHGLYQSMRKVMTNYCKIYIFALFSRNLSRWLPARTLRARDAVSSISCTISCAISRSFLSLAHVLKLCCEASWVERSRHLLLYHPQCVGDLDVNGELSFRAHALAAVVVRVPAISV